MRSSWGLKEKKQTRQLETVRRSKKGDLIPVGISFSLMKDKHGRGLGFSVIIRDITERKAGRAFFGGERSPPAHPGGNNPRPDLPERRRRCLSVLQ